MLRLELLIRRRRTARSKTPRALADGLMLVFSTLLNGNRAGPSRVISESRRGIDTMESILIIDDEAQIRSMIRLILEREGYVVMEAPDGTEGIRQFREKPTDLIITDIIMPNKDGIGMIIELKKEFPGVKIIAMSGGGLNRPDAIYAGPSNSAPPAPCPNRSTARICYASLKTP